MTQLRRTLGQRLAVIDAFAEVMKARIREEEEFGRTEWDRWTIPQMTVSLIEKSAEVFSSFAVPEMPVEDIVRTCANLANYAAIIADLVERRGTDEASVFVAPPEDSGGR